MGAITPDLRKAVWTPSSGPVMDLRKVEHRPASNGGSPMKGDASRSAPKKGPKRMKRVSQGEGGY